VRTHRFRDPCGSGGCVDGALNGGLVQMVTEDFLTGWVDMGSARGEDPLPDPLLRSVRVLAVQGIGQGHGARAPADVAVVLFLDDLRPGPRGCGALTLIRCGVFRGALGREEIRPCTR
jgi:hypothetical protein